MEIGGRKGEERMGEGWEEIRRRVKERVGDRGSKIKGLEETSKVVNSV